MAANSSHKEGRRSLPSPLHPPVMFASRDGTICPLPMLLLLAGLFMATAEVPKSDDVISLMQETATTTANGQTEVKGFNFHLGGAVCYVLRQNFGLKKICTGNQKYLGINVGNKWRCNKLDGKSKEKLKVIAGNRVLWECAQNCGSFSKKNGGTWSAWQGVHSGTEGVWARTMDKFKPKFSAVDSNGKAIAKFSGGFVRAGQSACSGDYTDRCAFEKNGIPRTQYTYNCLYKALECCVGNGGNRNRCGKTFSDCMGNEEAAALQLLQVQSNQTNDLDGLLEKNLDELLEVQTSTTDHAGATAGWNCG